MYLFANAARNASTKYALNSTPGQHQVQMPNCAVIVQVVKILDNGLANLGHEVILSAMVPHLYCTANMSEISRLAASVLPPKSSSSAQFSRG